MTTLATTGSSPSSPAAPAVPLDADAGIATGPTVTIETPRHPRLARLLASPQVRAALAFGGGGTAFSVANLLLARELRPIDFAVFALVVAILNLSVSVSALGLDGVVLRRLLPPGLPLLRRALVNAGGVSVLVTAACALLYTLPAAVVLVLLVGIASGGPTRVAAAVHQSRRDFGRALPIAQSDNLLALLAALLVVAAPGAPAWIAIGVVTLGRTLVATAGWASLLRRPRDANADAPAWPWWHEQLAFVSIGAAGALLVQLDRLVIPKVLPLEALATFGVLAAVVGAPFRVLQLAAGYTLTPRLRATVDATARRRLIRREGAMITGILVVASAAAWLAIPLISTHVLEGRYVLGDALVLATLFAGAAKVADAFIVAIVSALGGRRTLARLGLSGWATCVLSVVAGVVGGRIGGLTGLVLGVSLGWWTRAAIAGWLVRTELRDAV